MEVYSRATFFIDSFRFRNGSPAGTGVELAPAGRSLADVFAQLLSNGGRISVVALQHPGTADQLGEDQPATRRHRRTDEPPH